jgi:hypothetical protein
MVGLAKPSSLSDENLQMFYLVHQLSLGENMVKYTQKIMNYYKQHFFQRIPPPPCIRDLEMTMRSPCLEAFEKYNGDGHV